MLLREKHKVDNKHVVIIQTIQTTDNLQWNSFDFNCVIICRIKVNNNRLKGAAGGYEGRFRSFVSAGKYWSPVRLCRADTAQDHSRAPRACIGGPPKDWRRRTGRPRQTWLRTLAWRRQDGALWIDRHGVYSWMWLRPRDTLQRDREGERGKIFGERTVSTLPSLSE